MAKKNKGGRPSKYTPEMLENAKHYLANYQDEPYEDIIPSVVGMAIALNVAKSTLYKWASEDHPEFSDILDFCNDLQENCLINGALSNTMNSNIAKLVLGKHGYSDKQQIDLNDISQKPTQSLFDELKALNESSPSTEARTTH